LAASGSESLRLGEEGVRERGIRIAQFRLYRENIRIAEGLLEGKPFPHG
jgi:hypothetical protein